MYGGTNDRQRKHSRNAGIRSALLYWIRDRMGVRGMIGVTHIGAVTAQGTEEERRDMLRVLGGWLCRPDTQEVERLQSRVAELQAALDAHINAEEGEA